MASENETIADIVAYIRKCLDLLDTELTRKSNKEKPTMSAEALLCPVLNAKAALDRIESAWKREREALMPKPDPNWKAICEKCHDGDIEPDCEYYGEPMGCNSPIYGEHPKAKPVGNAAAMREALELLNQLFDSCVLGTNSDMTADEMDKVDELYFKTKSALSAPPRNCDIYPTNEDSWRSYQLSHAKDADAHVVPDFIDWLFAPAEKGADA